MTTIALQCDTDDFDVKTVKVYGFQLPSFCHYAFCCAVKHTTKAKSHTIEPKCPIVPKLYEFGNTNLNGSRPSFIDGRWNLSALCKYKRITLSVYISHPRLSPVQGSEYFRYLTPQLPKIGAHSTQHYFENILFERGNVLQLCRQSRPVELAHYL